MSKIKNQVIHSEDQDFLRRIREEAEVYFGRHTELREGSLTVFALPRKPQKPKKVVETKEEKAERWSKRERNFGYTRG